MVQLQDSILDRALLSQGFIVNIYSWKFREDQRYRKKVKLIYYLMTHFCSYFVVLPTLYKSFYNSAHNVCNFVSCFSLLHTTLFHKYFPLSLKPLVNTNFRAFITCYSLAVPRFIKPSPLSQLLQLMLGEYLNPNLTRFPQNQFLDIFPQKSLGDQVKLGIAHKILSFSRGAVRPSQSGRE